MPADACKPFSKLSEEMSLTSSRYSVTLSPQQRTLRDETPKRRKDEAATTLLKEGNLSSSRHSKEDSRALKCLENASIQDFDVERTSDSQRSSLFI